MTVNLQQLKLLYKLAEGGTWYTVEKPWLQDDMGTWVIAGSPDPHIGRPVCDSMEIMEWPAEEEGPDYSQSDDNMNFIVAVQNAFPELYMLARLGELVQAMPDGCSLYFAGRNNPTAKFGPWRLVQEGENSRILGHGPTAMAALKLALAHKQPSPTSPDDPDWERKADSAMPCHET